MVVLRSVPPPSWSVQSELYLHFYKQDWLVLRNPALKQRLMGRLHWEPECSKPTRSIY